MGLATADLGAARGATHLVLKNGVLKNRVLKNGQLGEALALVGPARHAGRREVDVDGVTRAIDSPKMVLHGGRTRVAVLETQEYVVE